jgi:hypothetical protein
MLPTADKYTFEVWERDALDNRSMLVIIRVKQQKLLPSVFGGMPKGTGLT